MAGITDHDLLRAVLELDRTHERGLLWSTRDVGAIKLMGNKWRDLLAAAEGDESLALEMAEEVVASWNGGRNVGRPPVWYYRVKSDEFFIRLDQSYAIDETIAEAFGLSLRAVRQYAAMDYKEVRHANAWDAKKRQRSKRAIKRAHFRMREEDCQSMQRYMMDRWLPLVVMDMSDKKEVAVRRKWIMSSVRNLHRAGLREQEIDAAISHYFGVNAPTGE